MPAIHLPDDLPIGAVLTLDQQQFELAKIEPYWRTDGALSAILHWRTECPQCGCEFTHKTGRGTAQFNRRCEEHRKAAKPVKGRRGRKVKVAIEPA